MNHPNHFKCQILRTEDQWVSWVPEEEQNANLKFPLWFDRMFLPTTRCSELRALTSEMGKRKRRNRRQRKKKCKSDVSQEKIIADWSSLSRYLLMRIFEKLTLIDLVSVDGVCQHWRSVLPDIPCWKTCGFPWLLMSGQKDREMRTCISILEGRVWEIELPEAHGAYIWGSYQNWLIVVNNLGSFSIRISLLNPFSRSKINLPEIWNFYHKMVLSGPPEEENLVCLLVHSEYQELAFWNRGFKSWRKHKLGGSAPFEDAIFCNGSFFLLCKDHSVLEVDAASILSSIKEDDEKSSISPVKILTHEVTMIENYNPNHVLKYLVEYFGEIFLVCRFFSDKPDTPLVTQNFKIYLLDLCTMVWNKVDNVGSKILYLGKCCSRFICSKELGVPITDTIYFANDDPVPWWNEWDTDHLKGIFARFGLDNAGRTDWGTFLIGKKYDNQGFLFRGDRIKWAPIWFTAPAWWYRKNFPMKIRN